MSVEDQIIDSFKEGGESIDLFKEGDQPSTEEFFNFLQIAIADRVFGGAVDPEKGAEWRKDGLKDRFGRPLKGLNLKDFVLSSGGKSKEAYASGLGIEEAIVDTVKYKDALNYEFIVGSKENPNMTTSKMSGSSTGNPNVSVFASVISDYQTAFLKKEGGDDPYFRMNDNRPDKYNEFMGTLRRKLSADGVEGFLQDPFWKEAYQKYANAFGSK